MDGSGAAEADATAAPGSGNATDGGSGEDASPETDAGSTMDAGSGSDAGEAKDAGSPPGSSGCTGVVATFCDDFDKTLGNWTTDTFNATIRQSSTRPLSAPNVLQVVTRPSGTEGVTARLGRTQSGKHKVVTAEVDLRLDDLVPSKAFYPLRLTFTNDNGKSVSLTVNVGDGSGATNARSTVVERSDTSSEEYQFPAVYAVGEWMHVELTADMTAKRFVLKLDGTEKVNRAFAASEWQPEMSVGMTIGWNSVHSPPFQAQTVSFDNFVLRTQ